MDSEIQLKELLRANDEIEVVKANMRLRALQTELHRSLERERSLLAENTSLMRELREISELRDQERVAVDSIEQREIIVEEKERNIVEVMSRELNERLSQ